MLEASLHIYIFIYFQKREKGSNRRISLERNILKHRIMISFISITYSLLYNRYARDLVHDNDGNLCGWLECVASHHYHWFRRRQTWSISIRRMSLASRELVRAYANNTIKHNSTTSNNAGSADSLLYYWHNHHIQKVEILSGNIATAVWGTASAVLSSRCRLSFSFSLIRRLSLARLQWWGKGSVWAGVRFLPSRSSQTSKWK